MLATGSEQPDGQQVRHRYPTDAGDCEHFSKEAEMAAERFAHLFWQQILYKKRSEAEKKAAGSDASPDVVHN